MDDQKYKDIIGGFQFLSFLVGITMVMVIGIAWKLKAFFWQ